jgi:hypothetical protein
LWIARKFSEEKLEQEKLIAKEQVQKERSLKAKVVKEAKELKKELESIQETMRARESVASRGTFKNKYAIN